MIGERMRLACRRWRLAIANFSQRHFGEGAEMSTRGRVRSPEKFDYLRAVVNSKSPPRFLAVSMLIMKLCNFLH